METKVDGIVNIPLQLKKDFRFCKVEKQGKKPLGMAWQEKNYKYDDYILIEHLRNEGNYGVIGGYGRLRIIDADTKDFAEYLKTKLNTLTIKTPGGGNHFYIKSDYDKNHVFTEGRGELRAKNYMVVGPGCYAIDKKKGHEGKYEVINDTEIIELSIEQVKDLIQPYIRTGETTSINVETPSDASRSGIEYRQVCSLISKGKTKEEVFQEMMAFIKWVAATDQYRELTYNKALKFIQHKKWKKQEKIINKTEKKEGISQEVLTKLALDERTEATEIMVKDILQNNKIYTTRDDEKSEMWIYYEGIYLPQGRTFLKEYCRKILGEAYTTHLSNQVVAKIEADTYIDQKDFFNNEHPDEIAVENGILNVIEKSLRAFDPNTIFFNKIPIKYTPQASCEAIITHLKAVLKYEEDLPVIQELFGYLLYKQYNIEKAFMFIGNGRNGKGKTLNIMKRFIGAENCSNISLEQIENESFAMGELFNKMANLAGDISKTSLRTTGKFKGLTGRDMMSAPRKFLPMVHFVNYAKMIFCANDLPITYDTTPAFWNRWLLIEFPYTFISQKEYENLKLTEPNGYKIADPNIVEKVTSPVEMQGLLCWALEGLDRLIKQGDFSYSKNMAEVQDLWMRKSSSFNSFMMDRLEYDYDAMIPKEDLRKAYAQYCKDYGLKPMSEKVIKNALTANFGAYDYRFKDFDGQRYVWKGVKFKSVANLTSFATNSLLSREKGNLHIDTEHIAKLVNIATVPVEEQVVDNIL